MNALIEKFQEVFLAVLPITVIVLLLNFTIAPIATDLLIRFIIGAILIVAGLSVFLCGVDIGVSPIGNLIGPAMTKTNKIWLIVISGLILGFVISIAEPDLHILADQVDFVSSGVISKLSIVVVVSLGIAVLMTLGLLRIIFNLSLNIFLTGFYLLVLILALFTSSEFLAISFDASGATTGAMTVPFILALAQGISSMKKDSQASGNDSFGLVAITSIGAILAIMIMNLIVRPGEITATLEYSSPGQSSIWGPFWHELPKITVEVTLALFPLLLIFLFCQKFSFHLPQRAFRKILKGLVYTFIGLVIFLVGVNAGFMDIGSVIGHDVAMLENKSYLVLVGFILGLVTILAEPAVYVLTNQIENVTSGYVKRRAVLFALSLGVATAVALSMVRILMPQVQLWHYLLPGYLIALALSYYVPKLFVGIAFDSGGVASGPMTATFILAFAHGAAEAIDGANVLVDGFGMIAMVALAPLIALQILGLIFKIKSRREGC